MRTALIILSSILACYAYVVYAVAIIKGKAKPHRTTRFVVLLIEALTVAALFAQGNTTAIWLPVIFTICSVIIFLLSIKNGMGGWEKTDLLCLGIALAGIIFWKLTASPLAGLLFSIAADFSGVIPTLVKTYRYPETEVWTFYAIGLVSVGLTMLAIGHSPIGEFIYPVYIFIVNGMMIFLILRKKTA